MVNKKMKIFTIAMLLNALPLSANQLLSLNTENNFVDKGSVSTSEQLNNDPLPLNNSKSYDKSNDPAFRRSEENSEGPQHGYFAVPILVLGLAGVLLYFSKSE